MVCVPGISSNVKEQDLAPNPMLDIATACAGGCSRGALLRTAGTSHLWASVAFASTARTCMASRRLVALPLGIQFHSCYNPRSITSTTTL